MSEALCQSGSKTHTRVKDPKCCRVSKMNNWPRAPVRANWANGVIIDGWVLTKLRAPASSDWPPLEGWMTGI